MENIKRVTSAILGLPMVIVVMLLGNQYVIDVAIAIVAIIALHEYFQAFSTKYKPVQWIGYLAAVSICFIHLVTEEQLIRIVTFSIPVVIAILFIQLVIKNSKINVIDIAITFLGIFYVVLFSMFIALLAGRNNGKILVWYIFIISWGTDTFAYLIGRKIGKHKFSKISPNKSIEGCIAGIVGSVLLSVIYTYCIQQFLHISIFTYWYVIIMAVVLSVIGQFGDFAASSIKRLVEIKDFSDLIPGHGGILDRIDSLLFIAPFAYILLTLI